MTGANIAEIILPYVFYVTSSMETAATAGGDAIKIERARSSDGGAPLLTR